MNTKNLMLEAISLPIEERMMMVDCLLKSLNPPDPEIDQKWGSLARRRLEDLRSGRVQGIPGDEVFDSIWKQFRP